MDPQVSRDDARDSRGSCPERDGEMANALHATLTDFISVDVHDKSVLKGISPLAAHYSKMYPEFPSFRKGGDFRLWPDSVISACPL
jgi:hypothetical protein